MLSLSNQSGNGFMKGVFITEAKIINLIDISGKPTYAENPDSTHDLAIEIEFDINKSWTKKVVIKGDFKKDGNAITGWGSAFVVKDFFIKIGCFRGLLEEEIKERIGLLEKKQIPADFLVKARNKKIYILDYVRAMTDDGKLKYSTWNIVDTDPEILKGAFKTSVAKGYPSNYKPELMDNASDLKEALPVETVVDDFPF